MNCSPWRHCSTHRENTVSNSSCVRPMNGRSASKNDWPLRLVPMLVLGKVQHITPSVTWDHSRVNASFSIVIGATEHSKPAPFDGVVQNAHKFVDVSSDIFSVPVIR